MSMSIITIVGPSHERRARRACHDWDRDYQSLRELSESNERVGAIWTTLAKVLKVFSRPRVLLEQAFA
jgi:hypothetical protein